MRKILVKKILIMNSFHKDEAGLNENPLKDSM